MNSKKRRFLSYVKIIVIVICLLILVYYVMSSPDITVNDILNFTPENLLAAAGILLLLYTLKSITFVFPIAVLEIVSGHLFPIWAALLVNLMGILIDLTIPYWIGHFSGIKAIQKLMVKYPKFEAILDRQKNNSFFLCFFLRIIGGLPADAVTMYFGATGTEFWKNVIGGVIGILPKMTLYTVWGSSIQEPGSPEFWFSFCLILLISAGSILGYYLYRRKLKNRQTASSESEVKGNE